MLLVFTILYSSLLFFNFHICTLLYYTVLFFNFHICYSSLLCVTPPNFSFIFIYVIRFYYMFLFFACYNSLLFVTRRYSSSCIWYRSVMCYKREDILQKRPLFFLKLSLVYLLSLAQVCLYARVCARLRCLLARSSTTIFCVWHTYEGVTAHIWMSHGTHMNELWHTYEWVISNIWMSHSTHMNESCHTCEWVMAPISQRACRPC